MTTRHLYETRTDCPGVVRWVNVRAFGPQMAAFEAEMFNEGFTAHEAYRVEDSEIPGLVWWRVELWAHE